MSTLLPEKEKFPRKIINFYRKVFPSTDENIGIHTNQKLIPR